MADIRNCEQCGAEFSPRREHARFCTSRCRGSWNRDHARGPSPAGGALDWSIAAMRETTGRLLRAKAWDQANAFAVITEAVWWVTMVDATLVRYHADTYNRVLADREGPERKVTEDTFTGLRFVRNRMGYEADPDDFIQPQTTGAGHPAALIARWTWKSVPEPALTELPSRGMDWEQSRHRAYQAQLASHPIGDTFRRAAEFLQMAAESRTGQD